MSFLAKYWNAVERAVSETGMNPGDIIVDIMEVCKNTEVHDTVESQVSDIPKPQPTPTPAQAGPMPQYKPDLAAMEAMARRSARPGEEIDRMEEAFDRVQAKRGPLRDRVSDPDTRGSASDGKATKAQRKQKRKQLKKLGGGRKVRIVIDEVRVNDRVLWSAPGPN